MLIVMDIRSLWQYYRDEPASVNDGNIIDFVDDNKRLHKKCWDNGSVKISKVPLKYLSNVCRTLEIPLINYKISLQLKWSRNCIIVAGTANNLKIQHFK